MRARIRWSSSVALALALAWAPVPAPAARTTAAESVAAVLQVTWTRPGTAGTLSPPSALRVGDRVTIGLAVSGFSRLACGVNVRHEGTFAWMGARQGYASVDGSGACTPWTFILPPIAPGELWLTGHVAGTDVDGGEVSIDVPGVTLQLQSGGTHRPFDSNYPVASWSIVDLLGTTSPSTNVPIVIPGPPGATRACTWQIRGEFASIEARPLDAQTCPDWEVTLPDPRPATYFGSPFGRPWDPPIRIQGEADDAVTGATFGGDTMTPNIPFSGNGSDTFASNLPSGYAPETTHPRFVLTGSTITVDPDFVNIDLDGECEMHYRGPITPDDGIQIRVPFTDGACQPVSFVATEPGGYNGAATVYIGGEHAAMSAFQVEVLDPMPPPELVVGTAVAGDPFEVRSSVASGVPSEFEITLSGSGGASAGTGALAAAAVAGETCASGYLDFEDEERSASGDCQTAVAGSHQVTVRFDDLAGAARTRTQTITVLAFRDIVGHKFALDITWLATEGITSGCTSTAFCPDGLVTRGQMATFLARALSLPPTSRDYFTDDETNKHEASINRLRAAGITLGCSATRFCPNGIVTRGQMATFLVRAFDLPATSRDFFTDDEGNTHEANINRLRAAAVTYGCGGTRFCPTGAVTRGQMAAFLHRAMD